MGNKRVEKWGLFGAMLATGIMGCSSGEYEVSSFEERSGAETFEEFVSKTFREPFENGVFIVDRDIPILNEKQLREIYEREVTDGTGLIVENMGGQPSVWPDSVKLNLTYCINNNFGTLKPRVIDAMDMAASLWEEAANIDFVYLPEEDDNCTPSNNNVLFDVFGTNDDSYFGRAFFPGFPRSNRNVVISVSTFYDQIPDVYKTEPTVLHELGHVLGFRHEHTREFGNGCDEGGNYFEATEIDRGSIMYYPDCGGTNPDFSELSVLDKEGAALVYGPPTNNGASTPPPTSTPSPVSEEFEICEGGDSSSVNQGEAKSYQPLFAEAGEFEVSITGSGDADLYVGIDSAPSDNNFACRPYLGGSNESCTLTIPEGGAEVFITVQGYESASFELNASWSCQGG